MPATNEEQHTQLYDRYRPQLPERAFQAVVEYCRKTSNSTDLALDIGCGNGISSLPLTQYYSQVIGVDVSECQIDKAPKDVPGLSFHLSEAESLPFIRSDSVDLITLACAIHWLDLDRFYPEVDRILKPGGAVVATIYYITTVCVDHPGIQQYLRQLNNEELADYWAPGLLDLLRTDFRDFRPPYGTWERNEEIVLEKEWTMEHIAGFLSSCSAAQVYQKAHPERESIGDAALRKMKELLSQDGHPVDDNRVFTVRFPLLMMFARKPGQH